MTEPGEERTDAAVLRDALIREAVALAVMGALLWYLGPGKIWLSGVRHRCMSVWKRRGDWIDAEVARFRGEVSRWDHEQASEQDRGPASPGGCGCGG